MSLLPEQQFLESSCDQGAANLEQRFGVSVHQLQWGDRNLNWTFGHGSTPGWYGFTINYQMDGDGHQDSYNVYLDNLTFSYQ